MITEKEIREMPLNQKLRLMEVIWDDLIREPESVNTPDWHRDELEATEARRAVGGEIPLDWEAAKNKLLGR